MSLRETTRRTDRNKLCWDAGGYEAWARVTESGAGQVGLNDFEWQQPAEATLPVRERRFIRHERVSVSGAKLGMTKEQIKSVLGEPSRTDYRDYYWGFDSTSGVEEIEFVDNRVVSIAGGCLEFEGRAIAKAGSSSSELTELFGREDDLHFVGPGGSSVRCWMEDDVVIEVVDDGQVGAIILGDPTRLGEAHVWYTSCGGP